MREHRFIITAKTSGQALAKVLMTRLRISRGAVLRAIRQRQVNLDGKPCTDPHRRIHTGSRVVVLQFPRPQPRDTRIAPIIRFADRDLLVVEKPAGLTTMRHASEAAEFGRRGKRFLPKTLAELLLELMARGRQLGRARLFAVHRVDKDTSGLVVFARTREAERHLGQQFRAHSVERRYLALVRGTAQSRRIDSWLVRDRGDGRRGSCRQEGAGKRAITHISVLERLGDYSLVECRLETGRTHQVRIHLGEAGIPICGERVYDRPLHGRPTLPDGSGLTRVALHASVLGFNHPRTGQLLSWKSPLPRDMSAALNRMRLHVRISECDEKSNDKD